MKLKIVFLVVFALFTRLVASQTIKGTVIDVVTKTPIDGAAIYFDNTTIGVITNTKGEFSIEYNNAIQSPLVITFLGYEKQLITDYRTRKILSIQLKESHEILGEVLINANDGLTREQKLKLFRQEFLGTSKFGKSCTILNEDALILKYHKKEKLLTAYALAPLKIENVGLQYLVTYNLSSFSAKFSYDNAKKNSFNVESVGFKGNPYYQNMPIFNNEKAIKNRKNAYQGSTLQFMRALYAENLKEKKFKTFIMSLQRDLNEVFQINFYNNTSIKKVILKQKPLTLLFKNKQRSGMQVLAPYFLVDKYGNYAEVSKVIFSGYIGSKRFGDLLPFDYGVDDLINP